MVEIIETFLGHFLFLPGEIVSHNSCHLWFGAIHKRRRNILGGRGSQIPMLQDIRRQKLGKSGSKFRYGGGRYQKRPKKLRRILWTAPFLYTFLYFDKQFALPSITRFIQSNDYFSKLRGYNLLYEPMCDQIQTPLTIVYFLTLHEISPIICKYLGSHRVWPHTHFCPKHTLSQGTFCPKHTLAQYTSARGPIFQKYHF